MLYQIAYNRRCNVQVNPWHILCGISSRYIYTHFGESNSFYDRNYHEITCVRSSYGENKQINEKHRIYIIDRAALFSRLYACDLFCSVFAHNCFCVYTFIYVRIYSMYIRSRTQTCVTIKHLFVFALFGCADAWSAPTLALRRRLVRNRASPYKCISTGLDGFSVAFCFGENWFGSAHHAAAGVQERPPQLIVVWLFHIRAEPSRLLLCVANNNVYYVTVLAFDLQWISLVGVYRVFQDWAEAARRQVDWVSGWKWFMREGVARVLCAIEVSCEVVARSHEMDFQSSVKSIYCEEGILGKGWG